MALTGAIWAWRDAGRIDVIPEVGQYRTMKHW